MAISLISIFKSFIPGMRLIDGGELQSLVNYIMSTQTGIVAKAGGGLTGAPVIGAAFASVDTCVTNNDSVALPPASPGMEIVVSNNGAATLAVFGSLNPQNAAGIADTVLARGSVGAGSASATQATGLVAAYICITPGQWKQILSA